MLFAKQNTGEECERQADLAGDRAGVAGRGLRVPGHGHRGFHHQVRRHHHRDHDGVVTGEKRHQKLQKT